MCGRFVQYADAEHYASRYADDIAPDLDDGDGRARWNVAPTRTVLAVRCEAGRRRLVPLRWGLVPHWSKGPDHRYSMINARAESVHERPAYRDAFRHRRCLIPVEGFYEWRTSGRNKQPHLIRRDDGAPFVLAGLWAHWQDPAGSRVIESCTIIVTSANELVADLHERMPVILDQADHAAWLDPANEDTAALRALLKPAGAKGFTLHPVSRAVNNPRNDTPELLAPTALPETS
jgi:putative SOS response-associated peptidase YedK